MMKMCDMVRQFEMHNEWVLIYWILKNCIYIKTLEHISIAFDVEWTKLKGGISLNSKSSNFYEWVKVKPN
jgi:hypothetical protein